MAGARGWITTRSGSGSRSSLAALERDGHGRIVVEAVRLEADAQRVPAGSQSARRNRHAEVAYEEQAQKAGILLPTARKLDRDRPLVVEPAVRGIEEQVPKRGGHLGPELEVA